MSGRQRASAPPVPLVLVRLKVRLLFNRAKSTRGGSAVLAAVVALFTGIGGFAIAAISSKAHDPRDSRALLVLGATMLLVGWALLPLVTLAADETLDPSRLVLLPIRRRPLMQGLLLASLVGFGPGAVMLALTGVVVGYGRGAGLVIVVFAMALLLVLCAATARTLTTALASRLTSRRGRDAMVIVASFLAIAVQGIRFLSFGALDPKLLSTIANVARWTPPGMLGQAVVDAHKGRLVVATLELLPPAAAIPVLLAVWGRVLDRALTVVTGASATLAARSSAALPLLPRRLPFIPASPWGAVAAKELRYIARDPRRKVLVLNSLLLGAVAPLYFGITRASSLSTHAVLFASLTGYFTVLSSMNQFGFDGGALWLDVVAGGVVRSELLGKNVATLITVVPEVFVAAVILAAFSGGWLFVPAALVLGLAGVGVGLAVANVTSVRLPQKLPDTRSPFGGAGAGRGCATGLATFLAMFIQAVLIAPIAIATAIALAVQPLLLVVVAPAAAGYGWLLWRAGVAMATNWATWRQPELLRAVDPARA